jgi:hypothetical protein
MELLPHDLAQAALLDRHVDVGGSFRNAIALGRYVCRNQISLTEWSERLRSTTSARVRVGRIFFCRFTRLISRHIRDATSRASEAGSPL